MSKSKNEMMQARWVRHTADESARVTSGEKAKDEDTARKHLFQRNMGLSHVISSPSLANTMNTFCLRPCSNVLITVLEVDHELRQTSGPTVRKIILMTSPEHIISSTLTAELGNYPLKLLCSGPPPQSRHKPAAPTKAHPAPRR